MLPKPHPSPPLTGMLLQPDRRTISHEQLVVEVKGIYAGLVMVESKCIDTDERQTATAQEKAQTKMVNLRNDQWRSLIALHKQLLHEHHDFFLASQHPSETAKGSIMTLFNPIVLKDNNALLRKQVDESDRLLDDANVSWNQLKMIDSDRSILSTSKLITRFGDRVVKIKRGLPGFINGSRTSALADTGAAQNVISAAFAQEMGLVLQGKAAVFRLGNSKRAQSIGEIRQAVAIVAVSLNTC